jgi:hypothetical protein
MNGYSASALFLLHYDARQVGARSSSQSTAYRGEAEEAVGF